MNPGECHCYSEQVWNPDQTSPSLAPLQSDRSEVNESFKSDCLDDIDLNLS